YEVVIVRLSVYMCPRSDPRQGGSRGDGSPPLLVVLPKQVANAADRRLASERAVWSARVVVAEPVWQCSSAVFGGAVAESVGPFFGHRLVEAFDFAVRAGPVGLGLEVFDPALAEELAEGAAVCVAPGVVGHQPLCLDPLPLEGGERALGESDHGRYALVGQKLRGGEAGVMVDDRVRILVADHRPHLGACLRAVTGDGVPGPLETRVARGVHVQPVARAGPLVTVGRLSRLGVGPGAAVALQGLRNSRVRMAELACEQARAPAGAAPGRADPLLLGRRQHPRATMRTARA